MASPLWTPAPERVAAANLTAFRTEVGQAVPSIVDSSSLYRWSVDEPAAFWRAVWRFTGLRSDPEEPALDQVVDDPTRMPGAQWFADLRLNFAENLLHPALAQPDAEALVFWNEEGRQRALTYGLLRREVARVAAGLRARGVGPGDRVAGFMPNRPEAVVAMLATASVGAVWSSCSPDFGAKGVLDRFGQITPRVLFTADGYRYNGKPFDSLDRVRRLVEAIPSIEEIVVAHYPSDRPDLSFSDLAVSWETFGDRSQTEPVFAHLPFDHPLYIMYSSGTTGLPKCMVHGAGGTLIQHVKELVLHTDLKASDRIFYFTTCGWMMWNWLVSSLAVGATVVLYDGSPFKPRPEILMDLAEAEHVSIFGTSAKYLALLDKEGIKPAQSHNLGALRTVLSTGSPLAHESYDYVYQDLKPDVCLSSISGGTDLISCFALGNPIGPVYRGELQTRGLGMAVEVWNDEGQPVVGEKGELVCTRAFPSMPVGFWNDDDGSRYQAAYFEHFPGIWRHGDWAEVTPRGGLIIHGRSDATLNPGGVRIGTAEIYRQVEQLGDVLESLVIGQQQASDVRIVLFVRLRDGVTLDDDLRDTIRRQVRANASPHHVPAKIIQVADLPRTRSGKITELAVQNVVHGRPVTNTDALANPEALALFRDLTELA